MSSMGTAALSGTGLYARWLSAPQYRLANLARDEDGWPVLDIGLLELISFDQCVILGAVCPTVEDAARLSRRDAVTADVRKTAFAAYLALAGRTPRGRRLELLQEVAVAVGRGVGSVGSFLPFIEVDPDGEISSAARLIARDLRVAARRS